MADDGPETKNGYEESDEAESLDLPPSDEATVEAREEEEKDQGG
jgi:hypothetical protein